MVPSLPFVLINGKTDLPRVGNKNMTGKLKKREQEKEKKSERTRGGKYICIWLQMETKNILTAQPRVLASCIQRHSLNRHTNIKLCIAE